MALEVVRPARGRGGSPLFPAPGSRQPVNFDGDTDADDDQHHNAELECEVHEENVLRTIIGMLAPSIVSCC
jgi:hypothetical protein